MIFSPAMEFAEAIELDRTKLHRSFASMSKDVIANLANPLTRQLAARTPDEVPTKGAIATALGTLSSFAIVGLRESCNLFLAQLAGLVGMPGDAASNPRLHRIGRIVSTPQGGAGSLALDRAGSGSLSSREIGN